MWSVRKLNGSETAPSEASASHKNHDRALHKKTRQPLHFYVRYLSAC
jgi:hypothetical protein